MADIVIPDLGIGNVSSSDYIPEEISKPEPETKEIPELTEEWKEAIDDWVASFSPITQKSYRAIITTFYLWLNDSDNSNDLEDISSKVIKRYRTYLIENKTNSMARKGMTVMKSFLKSLYTSDILEKPVHDRVVMPKVVDVVKEKKMLTMEQIDTMLSGGKNYRDDLVLHFLFYCGLRRDEVSKLRFENITVDLEKKEGSIHVIGKGRKHRKLALHPKVIDCLIEYIGEETSIELRGPDSKEGEYTRGYVFVTSWGLDSHISGSTITRIVKNAADKAGIEHVSPHAFRHAHASHALANGATLATVRDSLGHASVSTTNTYVHTDDNAVDYLK